MQETCMWYLGAKFSQVDLWEYIFPSWISASCQQPLSNFSVESPKSNGTLRSSCFYWRLDRAIQQPIGNRENKLRLWKKIYIFWLWDSVSCMYIGKRPVEIGKRLLSTLASIQFRKKWKVALSTLATKNSTMISNFCLEIQYCMSEPRPRRSY